MKPSKELIRAAEAVLVAKAYVATIKPKVLLIQRELLAFWNFRVAAEHREKGKEDERVLDPSDLFLLDETDLKTFCTDLHKLYLENGFNVEPEYCPLLMAETAEREAKRLLVKASAPIANVSVTVIETASVKLYEEYVELTLRYCAPFVTNRLKQ